MWYFLWSCLARAALSRLSDSWLDRMLINLLKLLRESRACGWTGRDLQSLSEQPSPRPFPFPQSRPALQHKERRLHRLPVGDKGWPANLWNVASFLTALDIKGFFFFFWGGGLFWKHSWGCWFMKRGTGKRREVLAFLLKDPAFYFTPLQFLHQNKKPNT